MPRAFPRKTYNTAAELTLTQNLPKDYFDAYYIKVHPDAVDNLKSIEVFYSDGTSWKSDASSWADTDNAVETDANGTPFFRVNLRSPLDRRARTQRRSSPISATIRRSTTATR